MSEQSSKSDSSCDPPMVCEQPNPPPCPARGLRGAVGVTLAVLSLLLVQVAVTAGIFVHFTAEISRVKQQQKAAEEWLCLSGHHSVQRGKENKTEGVSGERDGEACGPVAHSIRSLADKVVENVLKQRLVKDSSHRFHQSCRHLLQWDVGSGFSLINNMTMRHGRLRASQPGLYYIYSQTYFRYQHLERGEKGRRSERQLVQCVHKKTSYSSPTLLMKTVGTKCWAAEAEYGLNSLYQGGLFELKTGDELFVTVSDPELIDKHGEASYFGSFRLDL